MRSRFLMIVVALFVSTLTACSLTTGTAGVRPYPLDTCVVMGSSLGSMGDPIVKVYDGQQVKFCCAPCIDEFEADPEYYLSMIREADPK